MLISGVLAFQRNTKDAAAATLGCDSVGCMHLAMLSKQTATFVKVMARGSARACVRACVHACMHACVFTPTRACGCA